MPLEAVAINSFDAPIMRETTYEGELRARIAKMYDTSEHNTDEVMSVFDGAFKHQNPMNRALLYVGMFNDKPIVVVGCFDDGQTDSKRLQYLAVHPENVNRGVEAKFIKQVYDAEVRRGVVQFVPVDEQINSIMREYDLLTIKR